MLNVWTAGNLSGAIDHRQEDKNDYVFAYRAPGTPDQDVSLTMPFSLESYLYQNGLHPVFQMNLPEGRLRESLERTFRKRSEGFDQLKLLEIVGNSQIGRLRFSNTPKFIDHVPLQSVHELIAYNGTEDLLADLLNRFSAASGVSGVQPKVLIKDQDEIKPSNKKTRVTVKGATHIVKGWDANEYPHLAANEFFCMTVAKRSKLPVPEIALSENNKFLVIDRFDLADDGTYLGFEDFCSLNGIGTDEKYQGSYEKLAKRIRDFVSPSKQAQALETYFRSLALTCMLRNGDAHLKNFGVLYKDSTAPVDLAPAYDIVTTTPYIKGDSLALTLDGSKRFPEAARLIKFAKLQCNLQPTTATRILEEIGEATLKTMTDIHRHIKEFPDFSPIGGAMLHEWQLGVDSCCQRR